MSNKFLTIEFFFQKVFDISHLLYFWHSSLETLLHRRSNNLLYAVSLQFFAFRITTSQRYKTVESHLCCFFKKPLYAVEILGWSNCKFNEILPMVLLCYIINFNSTVFWMSIDDMGIKKVSITIYYHKRIAIFMSENTDCMTRLFFVKFMA